MDRMFSTWKVWNLFFLIMFILELYWLCWFVVTVVPVYMNRELHIIQSAGVEVRGLEMGVVAPHKCMSKPVLEKYVFTSYVKPAFLDLHTTLIVCTKIALENKCIGPVKVVEVYNQGTPPVSPTIAEILADHPFMKEKVTLECRVTTVTDICRS
jgi:hypothetical protein